MFWTKSDFSFVNLFSFMSFSFIFMCMFGHVLMFFGQHTGEYSGGGMFVKKLAKGGKATGKRI